MALSRRTLSVTTVVLLLASLGTGIWWRLRDRVGETAAEGQAAPEASADTTAADVPSALTFSADDPDPVEGAVAVRDTLWEYVVAPGKARALRSTPVRSQVAGVVRAVPVRESAAVAAGDVLVAIDTTELALEVASRRAARLRSRAEFEVLTMFDDVAIDDPAPLGERAEVTRARSGFTEADVALREAEMELRRARVRAPFAGRIADLTVTAGQYVGAGVDLMTLVALDPIEVEVGVLESSVPDLVEGRQADVRFAAFPGEAFRGRILSVDPVLSADRRAASVIVRVPNPGGRIKPGMFARVALQARAHADQVMVPRTAVLERGIGERRTMLFVYEDGLAKWRYVTLGPENERYVAIVPNEATQMVEPGETVLVDGHHYMAHDTRVRLVESVFRAGGRPGR